MRYRAWGWAIWVVGAVLAFLGVPPTWNLAKKTLSAVDRWVFEHAAYPSLFLLIGGAGLLAFAYFEVWPLLRDHFFPPKPVADTDAGRAFEKVLSDSKWAKQRAAQWEILPSVMYETGKPQTEVIEDRLRQALEAEIHRLLRNGDLSCWGHESLSSHSAHLTPQKPIEAPSWDQMKIKFGEQTNAWHTIGKRNGELTFVGLRFCNWQIRKQFPKAWWPRTKSRPNSASRA